MPRSTTYYTLIGSLPALPTQFEDAERVPITRIQLDERLRMLEPADAKVIEEMVEFLLWERQPLERTDEDVAKHAELFLETVDNRFARELILHVLNVRTIVAGLRSRRLGHEPPTTGTATARQIARYWDHPDFRLGTQYPWIADLDAQLRGDSPFDSEKMMFNIVWRYTKRLSEQYHFTFEAVVLYLLRWELVYRWTGRDAEAGQKKFEQLASEAMGPYANMFTESDSEN